MNLYHATSEKNAPIIIDEGFDMMAIRSSDPGDYGWGVYLTDDLGRAKAHDKVILDVIISTKKLAYIPNPYFLENMKPVEPKTNVEKIFYAMAFDEDSNMMTVTGHDSARVFTAKEIRARFLSEGYMGIYTDYRGHEIVIFDENAIKEINLRGNDHGKSKSSSFD